MGNVLVDTNILIDLVRPEHEWSDWSAQQVEKLKEQSKLCYNVVIYAEFLPSFDSKAGADFFFRSGYFHKINLPFTAAVPTARAFMEYRKRGGAKTSPLPDFFIGGHAEAEKLTILTRDTTRYRTYFPSVSLITPDT